ncbi:MAG: hypothetical protein ACI4U1_01600 [Anaerovoracaceae bacterium]
MIFFNPIMSILGIYVLAAVLPAFFLLRYIYKMDTIEKEPGYLLWALLLCEGRGDSFGKKINMALGYVFAVFLHGFYDSCCMIGTKEATAVFVIFVIAMYFIVFHMVKKASREDRPV